MPDDTETLVSINISLDAVPENLFARIVVSRVLIVPYQRFAVGRDILPEPTVILKLRMCS